MAIYHHKESDQQIRSVKWFRCTFPAFARLLEHPKNEGCGNTSQDRHRQAISKAEGVQAGVADLIFHVPSYLSSVDGVIQEEPAYYTSLAIEWKTEKGRQSLEQKLFQRYFEAAGGRYVIVRSQEQFQQEINAYMAGIPFLVRGNIEELHEQIEEENRAAARAELKRLLNKK